jgi:hypothetical protein
MSIIFNAKCRGIIFLILFLNLSCNLHARSLIYEGTDLSTTGAELVFDLKIIEISEIHRNGRICGYKYVGAILNNVKGDFQSEKISFGFWGGLEINHSYRVFLKKSISPEEWRKLIEDKNFSLDSNSNAFIDICYISISDEYYFFRSKNLYY